MRDVDPQFEADDPRAELFRTVCHLVDDGASRDQLTDAAVWASEILERDVVGELADMPLEAATEHLLLRAHDGFACECCGFHMLEHPATRDSHQLCSACGWEDSSPLAYNYDGSNAADLDSAQRSFIVSGASDESWLELVSPPPARQRSRRRFTSFEERRVELLGAIEDVFAGVSLGEGMTLEDARAADDYRKPRPEFDYQRTQPWTAVDDDSLDEFMEYVFLDHAGAFFYLVPAMRFVLTHRRDPGAMNGAVETILFFQRPTDGSWLKERATVRQLDFIADLLELAFDPWIAHSPHWHMMQGWSRKDIERIGDLPASIRAG